MKIKILVAMALFVSSVSFDQQVLQTRNGLDNSWSVSIQISNEAFAAAAAMKVQNF